MVGGAVRTGAGMSRAVAVVLAGTFALLTCMTFSTQDRAYAFSLPLPTMLPAGIAGTGILSGAGAGGAGIGVVAGYGGGGAAGAAGAAAAGAGAVAVAPIAIAAAAVIVTGVAVALAWNWAEGRNKAADGTYDPAAGPSYGSVLGNTAPDFPHTDGWGPDPYFGLGHMKVPVGTYYVGSGPAGSPGFGSTPQTLVVTADSGSGFTPWCTAAVRPCIRPAGSVGPGQAYKIATDAAGTNVVSSYGSPTTAPAGGAGGVAGSTPVTTRPTSQCSGGGAVAGSAVTFTGSTAPALLPELVLPACPDGQRRTGASFPTTFPDGTAAPAPLSPWTAPVVPSGYGQCNGTAGSCVLTLTRTAPDGTTMNCTGNASCAGWSTLATPEAVTTRTGAGTQTQTMPDGTTRTVIPRTLPDGSTMKCSWGPYTLPAGECTTVPTEPVTGTPGQQEAQDCLGAAVTLGNPASWVLGPVKCALRWAFVPTAGTMQAAQTKASDGWKATGLPAWGTAVGGVGTGLAGIGNNAGGCAGPHFSFTLKGHQYAFDPLNACSQPMQGAAVVLKLFATLAVLVAGARMCARPLLAAFGMGGTV